MHQQFDAVCKVKICYGGDHAFGRYINQLESDLHRFIVTDPKSTPVDMQRPTTTDPRCTPADLHRSTIMNPRFIL